MCEEVSPDQRDGGVCNDELPLEGDATEGEPKRLRRSYKELQGKSEQQQTYWSLQGCSVLNLMYKYNTIYQSSPTIKRKLYGSK